MAVIEKKKLSEKVVDEIRHRLDSGQLKVGDKLPNQNVLSRELGVSRTSLREAMNILDLLGVIEQRPGYGTVIRKKVPEINAERPDLTMLTDREITHEFLEAREVMECWAVRRAAADATPGEVKTLAALVEDMEAARGREDYEEFMRLDFSFHDLIASISSNRFLTGPATMVRQYMEQFIVENIQLMPGLLKESQQYHRQVFQSIADRNPDMAETQMRRHIRAIRASYDRYQEISLSKK